MQMDGHIEDFLCEELFPSEYNLGILLTAFHSVNSLLSIIFPYLGILDDSPTAGHDSSEKVITVTVLALSTRSLYKLTSLPSTIIFLGRQLVSVSVQAKRPLLRHSEMLRVKSYGMSKVVEP